MTTADASFSAASTEHAFQSFTAISLKPLLEFVTTECLAAMPASGLNLVDFVMQLLEANKERLYQMCRGNDSVSMQLQSYHIDNVPHTITSTQTSKAPIDTSRIQELGAPAALSSAPSPSSAGSAAGDPNHDALSRCTSAVLSGIRRRDAKFLRQVFERHQDGTGSLPASKLIAALTEADAPVIPDSDAAAATVIVRFDCNSNGLMEFSEFERAMHLPDELALYFQEKRQPALGDALRALVGRGSDQLLRVSQLPPGDMQAASAAVCASLAEEGKSLHEELQRSFAAQFEIQAQMEADAGKFNVVKMACGGIVDFHSGLTGRVGMPHLKFKDAMRQEHCEKAGCNTSFTTGNYKITTTPKQEWLYIAGDETGQLLPCPDMGHGRRIVRISELMQLKLAIDAKLTEVEMLAVVLYTGPMFQVSQQSACVCTRKGGCRRQL